MKIESKIGKTDFPSEKIYNFISDFRNFNNIIPQEKVSNWDAEKERCGFSIDMLGTVELNMTEKDPNNLVKIISDPLKSSQNFTLWIQIKELAENDSRIKITIEPQVNKMVMGMIKAPLKKFVDELIDQIQKFEFNTDDASS